MPSDPVYSPAPAAVNITTIGDLRFRLPAPRAGDDWGLIPLPIAVLRVHRGRRRRRLLAPRPADSQYRR